MQSLSWIVAGLFLPLFPLGMVFNALFQRIRNAWLRAALLLIWPLPGVWILRDMPSDISTWMLSWALLSAALYGFRAVVVREIGVWTGFLATSSWALIWVALAVGVKPGSLVLQAMAFSLPLALLALLVAELERRYESAYAGVVSGVAEAQPRLSGVLVLTVLAVIGSPIFPGFFSMLNDVTRAITTLPIAAFGLAGIWLLWSWAGARLLQGILVGPASQPRPEDLSQGITTVYSLSLVFMAVAGLYLSGVLL